MWLVFAAPASFLSLESVSQVVVASRWHLVMKLLSAAPASFLSAASDLQVAKAGPDMMQRASTSVSLFMDSSHGGFRSIVVCNPPINQPADQRRARRRGIRRRLRDMRVSDERCPHDGSGADTRCQPPRPRQARRRPADRYRDPPCPEELRRLDETPDAPARPPCPPCGQRS